MKITEANFVFTTKIKIDDTEWIELREPTAAEFQKTSAFKEDDGQKLFEQMRRLFPGCVVASSFTTDNGEEASGEEIFKALDKSSSLILRVITEWIQALPFSTKK